MKLRDINRIDDDTIEKTFVDYDGNITVKRDYNTGNAFKSIAHNKEFAPRGKDLYHIASLPLELIEYWRLTEGFDWFKASQAEKKEKLNNPDNKAFRVMEVKL